MERNEFLNKIGLGPGRREKLERVEKHIKRLEEFLPSEDPYKTKQFLSSIHKELSNIRGKAFTELPNESEEAHKFVLREAEDLRKAILGEHYKEYKELLKKSKN